MQRPYIRDGLPHASTGSWDVEKGYPSHQHPISRPEAARSREISSQLVFYLKSPFSPSELAYLSKQYPYTYVDDGYSTNSSSSSLDKEKVAYSDLEVLPQEDRVYTVDTELPDKQQPKFFRNLRFIIFIMYRRIFTLAILANIAMIVVYARKGWTSDFNKLALASIVNLLVSTLMRSEIYVNIMYGVICRIPQSWPLAIRKHAASVYHFGGLHSGCAIGSTLWLAYLSYSITIDSSRTIKDDTKVLTWCLVGYLFLMCTFAFPKFRAAFHNQFEVIHRFAGWTALAFVWVQSALLARDLRSANESIGRAFIRNPGLYCLTLVTMIIIYPWLHLRKVPVRTEKLSNHCIRMHFDYRSATAGSFQRISTDPLFEWHSFASISKPGIKGYSLVISKAGDWTSKIIANPPEKVWVRGIPTDGVMRVCALFRKLVVIGTGSGIGPCLAVLLASQTECRVIWTTPTPRETFKDEIVDDVLKADPNAIIHNTRKHGKPDLVKMAYQLYHESGAEGVVIISNTPTTKKVVYGLETRGIAAYGAIWDS